MKLDVQTTEVTLSNVGTTGEFRIRNSAKAFKILSDGLYSNKIRAIIRELSCNAVDSHVAAGKADVPFELHLPTILEPWFAVTDFGIGLSGDQVVNIYTTYFESTKTNSNDYIGALGLGSKSPFSYTDNFTVTAIKDGVQRIYSAFINDVGIPCVAEMGEESTDQPNGVEVKFSVTDRYDYNSFANEAQNVLRWFKVKPKITGANNFDIEDIGYKEKDIIPGVHIRENIGYRQAPSVAVMGNISYPLNKVPEPEKHFGNLATLLNSNLIIEFKIGELDFAASREELSFIPSTISNIKAKLEELNSKFASHIEAKAAAIKCEWSRAAYLKREYDGYTMYRAAISKYVTDTKFELFKPSSYRGFEFTPVLADLDARGLVLSSFRYTSGRVTNSCIETRDYENGNYIKKYCIPVHENIVFVLNDIKTGCVARAKYHFGLKDEDTQVICVHHSDPDMAIRQKEYDALMGEFHNPPVVVLASTLEKQPKRVRAESLGVTKYSAKDTNYRRSGSIYTWQATTEQFDEDTVYYYVPLSNHKVLAPDGNSDFDMDKVFKLMNESGIPGLTNITIYGIRKSRIKDIQELDNWVLLTDKLKEEVGKISEQNILSLVVMDAIDSYANRVYINKGVVGLVGPDSTYSKFVEKYGSLKKATGYVSSLVELCNFYGKTLEVMKVRQQIEDDKTDLYKKYPLLKFAKDASISDVADYIKMVDKLNKLENTNE